MKEILDSGIRPPSRILRLPPVRARTGLARNTIFSRIARGRFPRLISLGERALASLTRELPAQEIER